MPYIMKIGKFKGQPIDVVPDSMLVYYQGWDGARPDLVTAIKDELERRRGGGQVGRIDLPREEAPRPYVPNIKAGVAASTPAQEVHAAALVLIQVGANALDGLPYTGDAATWLRELAGASPPSDVPF